LVVVSLIFSIHNVIFQELKKNEFQRYGRIHINVMISERPTFIIFLLVTHATIVACYVVEHHVNDAISGIDLYS